MTTLHHMADAAFAANIPPGFPIVAGYFPGRDDFHPWSVQDWQRFPGYKLPITVPAAPGNGPEDGAAAVAYLRDTLHVPAGCYMMLDLEGRVDVEYVLNFGAAVAPHYRVWVYGEESTVFGNPPLNGYIVASFGITAQQIMETIAHPHVRGVQYQDFGPYDASLIEQWTEGDLWH